MDFYTHSTFFLEPPPKKKLTWHFLIIYFLIYISEKIYDYILSRIKWYCEGGKKPLKSNNIKMTKLLGEYIFLQKLLYTLTWLLSPKERYKWINDNFSFQRGLNTHLLIDVASLPSFILNGLLGRYSCVSGNRFTACDWLRMISPFDARLK